MNGNEVIRITTTADKAAALADAGRRAARERDRAETPDPVLAAAVEEVEEALGQPDRKERLRQTLLDMGYPKAQTPLRLDGGRHDDYVETHPAYAMIGASRVQSSGTALAGSDFDHHAYMTVTVKRAKMYRGLSEDRWHGHGEIIEVRLSEAQWATFVSGTNMGDGVPCTLSRTETDGPLPEIIPITNRREQANADVQQTLADAVARLDAVIANPKVTKAVRDGVTLARQELLRNLPFVIEQADRHMEATIEHAKVEVEAYVTGMVHRAGIAALGGQTPIALLTDGEPK